MVQWWGMFLRHVPSHVPTAVSGLIQGSCAQHNVCGANSDEFALRRAASLPAMGVLGADDDEAFDAIFGQGSSAVSAAASSADGRGPMAEPVVPGPSGEAAESANEGDEDEEGEEEEDPARGGPFRRPIQHQPSAAIASAGVQQRQEGRPCSRLLERFRRRPTDGPSGAQRQWRGNHAPARIVVVPCVQRRRRLRRQLRSAPR